MLSSKDVLELTDAVEVLAHAIFEDDFERINKCLKTAVKKVGNIAYKIEKQEAPPHGIMTPIEVYGTLKWAIENKNARYGLNALLSLLISAIRHHISPH